MIEHNREMTKNKREMTENKSIMTKNNSEVTHNAGKLELGKDTCTQDFDGSTYCYKNQGGVELSLHAWTIWVPVPEFPHLCSMSRMISLLLMAE